MFKARVALGLTPSFERFLYEREPGVESRGPLPESAWMGDTLLALSPDEESVFVSGTYHGRRKMPHHAVYRLEWRDRAVTGPELVAVHPRTRALYVLSVKDRGKTARYAEVKWELYEDKSLVKFASLDDFREVARLDFPKAQRYFHACGPLLALDASGERPVLWVSMVVRTAPRDFLWRIVDRGAALERTDHKVLGQEAGSSKSSPLLAAARGNDEFYLVGGGLPGAFRAKAGTGRLEPIPLPDGALKGLGAIDADPEGLLYVSCNNGAARQ